MTWEASVDEALCWGWIDGIRRRLDDASYSVRFTPRRPDSVWSQRNLDRVDALRAAGRMQPAGLAVWEARDPAKSGYVASTSQDEMTAAELQAFGVHLEHFMAQPPGYRRQMAGWIHAAKKDETRARRLEAVIEASRQGIRVEPGRPFAHLTSGTSSPSARRRPVP